MMQRGQDILDLIPQAEPFVMVDALYYTDEHISRSSFHILASNVFVEDGVFTEPGLMENIAQTAAARAGTIALSKKEVVQVGYIGAVKNFEVFFLPPVEGDIVTEVKIDTQVFDMTVITGRIWCNENLVARCEMNIFLNKSE